MTSEEKYKKLKGLFFRLYEVSIDKEQIETNEVFDSNLLDEYESYNIRKQELEQEIKRLL